MSVKIITEQAKTLSVPEAGKIYYGIGRGASYAAAANGQIPTIRIGKLLRVPIAAMERWLERAAETA
jgi:excisionase family DNA binding protein